MRNNNFSPYQAYQKFPVEVMRERARSFCKELRRRRTVRNFSSEPVPRSIIEDCIRSAGSAPSGANKQPWHFVAVSNPGIKQKVRTEAEKQEREFYEHRATDEWLEALEPLGTDSSKPFLEDASYLIAIFAERYNVTKDNKQQTNY